MNPIRNTLSITTSAFSQHTRDQQVSAYNHSCLTIIQSHGCKETPVGILQAEKMAELILINVLLIGFSACPLLNHKAILVWFH